MRIRRCVLLAAIAGSLASCAKEDPRTGKIDELCSEIFPDGEPGAAVLVLEGDNVLFEKGYGLADLGSKARIDGNTSFNIASVSKQFTATAILQLAEKEKLKLTDPVVNADGIVTNYSELTILGEGAKLENQSIKDTNGTEVFDDYTVRYHTGEVQLTGDGSQPYVRIDTIHNIRKGGVEIRLNQWNTVIDGIQAGR